MCSLTHLRTRVKLQRRHLLEWEALGATQRHVWVLLKEAYLKTSLTKQRDTVAEVDSGKDRFNRYGKLMERQRQERQQMRLLHEQEMAFLQEIVEQAADSKRLFVSQV